MLEVPHQGGSTRQFLPPSAALESILHDARMYPDPEAFARVLVALAGGEATLGEAEEDSGWPVVGVWYRTPEAEEAQFIRERAFAEALTGALSGRVPAAEVLAEAYSLVMDVRAAAGVNDAGEPGLWVHTEMEKFRCLQCGHCCRGLGDAFATSADMDDVDRWEREGRFDILEWVDLRLRDVGMMDLWIDPATGDEATRCPWLRKVPREHRYRCRIHDTKPRHCREYPKSKKHALMTGCPGFQELPGGRNHYYSDPRELRRP
ncbi:MAG: YkgJ family cysteine cluster protein [Deltaproteobacteria bacterium]|nr:YkgJ family cysteine cluster protein [Deltaproteobacteria bacterium]